MKFADLLEAIPYPTALLRRKGLKVVRCNSAFSALTGSTVAQEIPIETLLPEVLELLSPPPGGTLAKRIYIRRASSDELFPVEVNVSPLRENYFLLLLRDLSGGVREQLEKMHRLYKALSRMNLLVTTAKSVADMLEGCVSILFDSGLFKYVALLPKGGAKPYAEKGTYTDGGNAICMSVEEGDSSCYLLVSKKRGENFSNAELDLLTEVVHDIAFGFRRFRMEAEEERRLQTDPLTGLPNRLHFVKYLEQTLSFARSAGRSVALLILDVDRFRDINQAFGQAAGDRLLVSIAESLRSLVRRTDLIARTGSDEFAVILVSSDPVRAVLELMRRIREHFSRPLKVNSHSIYVTFSGGASIFPSDTEAPDLLCANATASLQRSKRTGGNSVVFFSQDIVKASEMSLKFRTDLREALEKGEFVLHYQPKIDLRTGKMVGVEALIRWVRNGEIVPPMRFLPLAEEEGLIHEIGLWVLKEACRQIKRWKLRGKAIPIAVNVSASQLKVASFAGGFPFVTAGCGDSMDLLEVEITESALMEDPAQGVEFVNTLTSYGIKTYIDDFGTGYSSLAYLKKLPVYAIKIDREFIRDLPQDRDSVDIVKATIGLAKAFGLKTVAEGVETKEQAEFLRKLGCDQAQGYFFSPPLPEDRLEVFVEVQGGYFGASEGAEEG